MKIAVTTTGPTLESAIFEEFAQTPYVLVVDVDAMACTPIEHAVSTDSGRDLARTVLAHRCEAVITGKLAEAAFDILADDGVTRFLARNMSAREALDAMKKRQLDLIRNPDGSGTCSGSHHH